MVQIFTASTCMGCGCVCDDIELEVADGRVLRTERTCDLGTAWYASQSTEADTPGALIDGVSADPEAATLTAAAILNEARFPLIYGLGQSTIEAQREAVWLTETVGGVIDSHTSCTHGPTKTASQLVGKVACSLGEVRNRADLILYWGTNPIESHPRHLERYAVDPVGRYVPDGRSGRTVVVIDVRPTPTSARADRFLQIRPGTDFEVLTALRALLRGQPVDPSRLAETGLTQTDLLDLLEYVKRSRFGVLFFGTGLTATRGKHLNAAAALSLVAEFNAITKFAAVPMRDHGNEAGMDHVLCWTSGYPIGVDYSRGYPRSNPGEFTAVDLLTRGDVDAAVVIGDGPWAPLPAVAVERLRSLPIVVLNSRITELSRTARVHLTTAPTGTAGEGTVYRMDKIPLPLRRVLVSQLPSEERVLARIRAAAS